MVGETLNRGRLKDDLQTISIKRPILEIEQCQVQVSIMYVAGLKQLEPHLRRYCVTVVIIKWLSVTHRVRKLLSS
jgi:hypothetical protein